VPAAGSAARGRRHAGRLVPVPRYCVLAISIPPAGAGRPGATPWWRLGARREALRCRGPGAPKFPPEGHLRYTAGIWRRVKGATSAIVLTRPRFSGNPRPRKSWLRIPTNPSGESRVSGRPGIGGRVAADAWRGSPVHLLRLRFPVVCHGPRRWPVWVVCLRRVVSVRGAGPVWLSGTLIIVAVVLAWCPGSG
jgi:hypothetical protein